MPEIIFKEETHTYFVDGIKRPCVSEIVKPLSVDYSMIQKNTLNHKRDLGKAFHHAIHLFLLDDLDWDTLDERLVEPMKGFKEFWTDDEFKNKEMPKIKEMHIEEKMYHPKLNYCGTPDLILLDKIYDWKFREYDLVSDPLRMAGYELLAGIYPIPTKEKVVVCFKKDGCYRRYNAERVQAISMFRVCLENYEENQRFADLCEKWKGQFK